MAEEEIPLTADGGSVTHPIRVRLGPTQDQTPLVAGTVEVLMVEAHLIVGNSFPLY